MTLMFRDGFLWGVATAAHQVEGDNRNSDRTDIDTVSAELLAVVTHTTQPTTALLWLRPLARQSRR